jgi:hypothetical protein
MVRLFTRRAGAYGSFLEAFGCDIDAALLVELVVIRLRLADERDRSSY